MKELHADETGRMRDGRGELGDRKRRRGRSDDSIRVNERIELLQDLHLELEALRHRLDHDIGGCQSLIGYCPPDTGEGGILIRCGDLTRADKTVEIAGYCCNALGNRGVTDIDEDDVEAGR